MLMSIISFNEWLRNPIWGCGIGGYMDALSHGLIDYFTRYPNSEYIKCVGSTSLSFNEYLKIAVEQGIIGLILHICLVGISFWRLFKCDSPLALGLIGICIVSLFSYPFILHSFCLLMTIIVAIASNEDTTFCSYKWSRISFGGILVSCICMIIIICPSVERRVAVKKMSFKLSQDTCFIDDYYEMLPNMYDNREFMFNFAMTLRKGGRFNDSNAILRFGSVLDTEPMTLVIMGRNYEDMGFVEKSDSLYSDAFYLQPNRIYALYRQMKLYESQQDTLRMIDKAKQIVKFQPKIHSDATIKIQNIAHEMLEK
jgi:hypothetical protein